MSLKDLVPTGRWERERMARRKIAIGAAIGLTVGAVAGVLLAPKTGKETREDIVKTIQELPEKAKKLSEKTQTVMGEIKEEITEKTDEIMDEAKEAVSDTKDYMHDAARVKKVKVY